MHPRGALISVVNKHRRRKEDRLKEKNRINQTIDSEYLEALRPEPDTRPASVRYPIIGSILLTLSILCYILFFVNGDQYYGYLATVLLIIGGFLIKYHYYREDRRIKKLVNERVSLYLLYFAF